MKKRTDLDFSKHELTITVEGNTTIHHLKKPDTFIDSIKFINTNGVLVVTGDYGNWIFCREFHPSEKEYVSDGYWLEKLKISSSQEGEEFDSEATEKKLKEMIIEYENKREVVDYLTDLLDYVNEDEFNYRNYAFDNTKLDD